MQVGRRVFRDGVSFSQRREMAKTKGGPGNESGETPDYRRGCLLVTNFRLFDSDLKRILFTTLKWFYVIVELLVGCFSIVLRINLSGTKLIISIFY